MNVAKLREIIWYLVTLHPEDDFGIEKCWDQITDILSQDVTETISFIENDCTDEEFYWLGAIFEDVAERTNSKEFVDALRKRLKMVNPETYCKENFKTEHMRKFVDYNEYVRRVSVDIDYAEARLE